MDHVRRVEDLCKDTVGCDRFIAKSDAKSFNIGTELPKSSNVYQLSAMNISPQLRLSNSRNWEYERFGNTNTAFCSARKLNKVGSQFHSCNKLRLALQVRSNVFAALSPLNTAAKSCSRVHAHVEHIPPLNSVLPFTFARKRNHFVGNISSSHFHERRNNFGGPRHAFSGDFPLHFAGQEEFVGAPCRSPGCSLFCSELDKYPVHVQQGFATGKYLFPKHCLACLSQRTHKNAHSYDVSGVMEAGDVNTALIADVSALRSKVAAHAESFASVLDILENLQFIQSRDSNFVRDALNGFTTSAIADKDEGLLHVSEATPIFDSPGGKDTGRYAEEYESAFQATKTPEAGGS